MPYEFIYVIIQIICYEACPHLDSDAPHKEIHRDGAYRDLLEVVSGLHGNHFTAHGCTNKKIQNIDIDQPTIFQIWVG